MTAQRLPIPGGDNGTWGTILNGFLGVAHNADGTLIPSAVTNAGAITSVNGKTGSSVSLAASDVGALTESTANGLYAPNGTYVSMATSSTQALTGALTSPDFFTPGYTADNATDNAPFFNSLVVGAGTQWFPRGTLLCNSPITIPNKTQGFGQGRGDSGSLDGTTLKFNPATIMAGGNTATVVANGTNWVFTIGSGHGLSAGNTIDGVGFTHAGFNVSGLVLASVTATTLTVTNATIPAASDSGSINVHLVSLGQPLVGSGYAFGCRLENLTIDCQSIPGSIGGYSSCIQEQSGFVNVLVANAGAKGVYVASGASIVPANFSLERLEIYADSTGVATSSFVGVEVNTTAGFRHISDVTVASNLGASYPIQGTGIRVNSVANGAVRDVHIEEMNVGVLIGDLVTVNALTVDNARGDPGVTGTGTQKTMSSLVQVGVASSSPVSHAISLMSLFPYNATNVVADLQNSYTFTTASNPVGGYYRIGSAGAIGAMTLESNMGGNTSREVNGVTYQTATVNLSTLTGIQRTAYATSAQSIVSNVVTFNPNSGRVMTLSLTANVTSSSITAPTAAASGTRNRAEIVLSQTGAFTFVPPTNIKWAGGSAPTWSTTSGYEDRVELEYDGSTNWYEVSRSIGIH